MYSQKEKLTLDTINPNLFYTTDEIASLLRVSERTLRRYCRDKILPGLKVGGKQWIVKGKDLLSFIEEG